MAKYELFYRGVPTEPDVTALLNKFGVPTEDVELSHADVAAVFQVDPKSSRFKTVTAAWRKRLKDLHHVLIGSSDGAFRVLKPSERVGLAKSKSTHAVRTMAYAGEIVTSYLDRSRLTLRETEDADKVQRITAAGRMAAIAEARKSKPAVLRSVEAGKQN